MKRLFGLSVALLLGVTLITTMSIPKEAHAISAMLTGLPISLNATELVVSSLIVEVKKGWINSDAIALDITIVGTNNRVSFRGRQIVPLSAIVLFPSTSDRDLVDVGVDWDDQALLVHADAYDVCVQEKS